MNISLSKYFSCLKHKKLLQQHSSSGGDCCAPQRVLHLHQQRTEVRPLQIIEEGNGRRCRHYMFENEENIERGGGGVKCTLHPSISNFTSVFVFIRVLTTYPFIFLIRYFPHDTHTCLWFLFIPFSNSI